MTDPPRVEPRVERATVDLSAYPDLVVVYPGVCVHVAGGLDA